MLKIHSELSVLEVENEMIPFHQYQRYKIAQNIINKIRSSDSMNILEVGSNSHKNLKEFFPDDVILYSDIVVPDELLSDPFFIKADATQLEFEENSFDIVIALDVLEHIPPIKREAFLKEVYRVSKCFVLISAPFKNSANYMAENRISSFYKTLFNKDIIWQKEHSINGLPSLNETLNVIDQISKYKPSVVSHGDVELWEKLMMMEFITGIDPRVSDYWNNVNSFYNNYLCELDYTECAVRSFVMIPKGKEILLSENENKITDEKRDSFLDMEENFYRLFMSLKQGNSTSRPRSEIAQLFLDTGDGFHEDQSINTEYVIEKVPQIIKLIFHLHEFELIKSIRLDPMMTGCMINVKSIILNSGFNGEKKITSIQSNASYELDNLYIFETTDPQLIITDELVGVEEIIFELEILDDLRSFIIINKNANMNLQVQKQMQNDFINELERLRTSMEVEYQSILLQKDSVIDNLESMLEQTRRNLHECKVALEKSKEASDLKGFNIHELKEKINRYEDTFFFKIMNRLKKGK